MIRIKDLVVTYGDTEVLSGIDLDVASGEFVTLLGPSGCGKSTLLRTIGGFIPAAAGLVEIEGRDVTTRDPEDRGIGFVFQSYALFPHLSVSDNIGFGLATRKIKGAERHRRIAETLAVTGLEKFADKMPSQLSGGQQQRVAIARVLVTQPSVLLMDEPLSNLDAQLRVRLRDEIRRLHEQLGITTLYVTHDQDEALSMSDRVAVMKDGRFEQLASPRAVYENPETAYVCSFVGESNVMSDELARQFGAVPVEGLTLHVRPERISLNERADAAYHTRATIATVTFLGGLTRYVLEVGEGRVTVTTMSDGRRPLLVGDTVACSFNEGDALWLK